MPATLKDQPKVLSTRTVQVYRVREMYEYYLPGDDDVEVLAEALNKARAEHLPGVVADCKYVAVLVVGDKHVGARRDIFNKVPS